MTAQLAETAETRKCVQRVACLFISLVLSAAFRYVRALMAMSHALLFALRDQLKRFPPATVSYKRHLMLIISYICADARCCRMHMPARSTA